jgi:BolA family transcriptional regulator, general stress-responsive regulator
MHGIKQMIVAKINEVFPKIYFEVKNESFMHHVPEGSETHFRVVIVSELFEGKKILQRHRIVQSELKECFALVKAVHLVTHTPTEWESIHNLLDRSPSCVN